MKKSPSPAKNYSTPITVRISRALSALLKLAKCRCTARNIFRALFCEKVSLVVAVVVITAMWWHNISIDNVIEAQEAVGTDCLYGMPWAIVWACRATFADTKSTKSSTKSLCSAKKGGQQ
ncbi:MAG: hypothetical protein K2M07_08270 [Muribaculaceae bacterium]|nr:hypothetical protein [Muribaculaceae bacterium]